jgi:hypothetical protein
MEQNPKPTLDLGFKVKKITKFTAYKLNIDNEGPTQTDLRIYI